MNDLGPSLVESKVCVQAGGTHPIKTGQMLQQKRGEPCAVPDLCYGRFIRRVDSIMVPVSFSECRASTSLLKWHETHALFQGSVHEQS